MLHASSHEPGCEQTDTNPENSEDLSASAQVNPDEEADHYSQRRNEQWELYVVLGTELVVDQSGSVDPDKRDECAEVEQFGALLVG